MTTREEVLMKLAEKQARISFGTHEITMEQWATIYDRVEWTFRDTTLEGLGKVALDETLADYDYDAAEDSEDRHVDRMVADERRAPKHTEPSSELSMEASYA